MVLIQEAGSPYILYEMKGLISMTCKGQMRFLDNGTWEDVVQHRKVRMEMTDEGAKEMNAEMIKSVTAQFAAYNVQVELPSLGTSEIVVENNTITIDMSNSEFVITASK